jgi:hypothetical protein
MIAIFMASLRRSGTSLQFILNLKQFGGKGPQQPQQILRHPEEPRILRGVSKDVLQHLFIILRGSQEFAPPE